MNPSSRTAAYLYLDSDDRVGKPSSDSTDVNFSIDFKANKVNRLALSSYDFITSFDNINETTRTSYFETAALTYPVTLPNGTYNLVQFRDQMKIQLDLIGLGAWTITIVGGKYRFVAPVPVTFITNPVRPNSKDWADMAGIKKGTPLTTFHNAGVTDIVYTNKLYIQCDEAHRFKVMGDEGTSRKLNNILGVVYVNDDCDLGSEFDVAPDVTPRCVYPHHSTREIRNLKWIKHNNETEVSTLNIRLLDDRGERIPRDQVDNVKWSLELLIEN